MTTDSDVVDSSALSGAPQGGEAPKLVEVEINGAKHQVTPEVAAGLKAAQAAAASAPKGLSAEEVAAIVNGALDARLKPAAAPAADKGAAGRFDTDLFTAPTATLERVRAEAVEQAKTEVMTAYQQAENQRAFWAEFYRVNPDLKEDDMVVRAVLQNNFGEYSKLSVATVIEKLGTASKEKVLAIQSRGKGGKSKPGKQAAEGGNHPTPEQSNEGAGNEESQQPGGLSAVLKARRDARRASAGGKKAA